MTVTHTFNGAKNGFTFLFAYLNMVAQDIGMERAMALDANMCEAMGAAWGQSIKAQAGIEEADARAAVSLARAFLSEAIGISTEVAEEGTETVMLRVGRCPLYEAAQVLGMDNTAIEALCRTGAIRYMDAMVKQFNPDLDYELGQFRLSADAPCVETIAVERR
jgi:hypothetical protein